MKKRFLFFIPIILIGLFFVEANAGFHTQKLAKNLEYGILEPTGEQAKLHFIRFSLKDYQIRPIQATDYGATALNSQEMAESSLAIAVINANFFDQNHKALGLIIDQKKIKNPLHPSSWWASLLIKGDKANIILKPDKTQFSNYDFGIQAGPRIVVDGKVNNLKSHLSAKSAIGIDNLGRLVIVATEGSLDMRNFARYLALPVKAGGLGLRNVLNLDGGSSTQFYIKLGDFKLDIPSYVKVPVGIGVFPRIAQKSS